MGGGGAAFNTSGFQFGFVGNFWQLVGDVRWRILALFVTVYRVVLPNFRRRSALFRMMSLYISESISVRLLIIFSPKHAAASGIEARCGRQVDQEEPSTHGLALVGCMHREGKSHIHFFCEIHKIGVFGARYFAYQ